MYGPVTLENKVSPLTEITGVGGNGLTITVQVDETLQPLLSVMITEYAVVNEGAAIGVGEVGEFNPVEGVQKYVKGGVPPVAGQPNRVESPRQIAILGEPHPVNCGGSVIVAEAVAVHPTPSVMVIV